MSTYATFENNQNEEFTDLISTTQASLRLDTGDGADVIYKPDMNQINCSDNQNTSTVTINLKQETISVFGSVDKLSQCKDFENNQEKEFIDPISTTQANIFSEDIVDNSSGTVLFTPNIDRINHGGKQNTSTMTIKRLKRETVSIFGSIDELDLDSQCPNPDDGFYDGYSDRKDQKECFKDSEIEERDTYSPTYQLKVKMSDECVILAHESLTFESNNASVQNEGYLSDFPDATSTENVQNPVIETSGSMIYNPDI